MSEQPTLLDPPNTGRWEQYADALANAPRCRMCERPAWWSQRNQQYLQYCTSGPCANRQRVCQKCGDLFAINVDGAGTKYCSTACKTRGYHPETKPASPCAWCGRPNPSTNNRRITLWPYICDPCLEPIKRVVHQLKAHHVPHERARQLREDPSCEVCGTNTLAIEYVHGKAGVALVVDHDHRCCPVATHSCGQCIRGLLCKSCNIAAGMLRDNPKNARMLGDYIEAWNNMATL